MAEIRLRGLVLRETDFGDCDRYLSLLTEDGRRTEILHRNAKRSRKHAAVLLFRIYRERTRRTVFLS